MAVRVGVVGSLGRSNAIFLHEDGEYIDSNEMHGIHWRAQSTPALTTHVTSLIRSIAKRHGNCAWGRWDRCSVLAVAMSGVDPAYPDPILQILARELGHGATSLVQSTVLEAGYCGALLGEPAILVHCGMGWGVFGVNSKGETRITNTLSSLFGVPGSGYSIGQQVFWAIQKSDDGRAGHEEETFSQRIMERLSDSSFRAYFRKIDDARRVAGFHIVMQYIYDLAETCVLVAEEGDPVAEAILQHAVEELLSGVMTVSDELGLESEETVPLAFRGGMASNCHPFCARIATRLREVRPKLPFQIRQGRFSPIVGIALFALAGDRSMPEERLVENLLATLPSKVKSPFLYADSYYSEK